MLSRYLGWGIKNVGLAFLILLIYFLFVVLPHEQVGILISKIFRPIGRDNYNLTLTCISLFGLGIYLFKIYKLHKQYSNILIPIYLFTAIILAVICFKVLFVVNVEAIHFLQYLVFAFLCFPLFSNYNLALFYTTLAGSIDEAYQYFYLAPEKNKYFDFNDVIIDMIGGVFGLLLVRSLGRAIHKYNFKEFIKSKHSIFIGSLVSVFILLYIIGYFRIYYEPTDLVAKFWLVTEKAKGFWSQIPKSGPFHIITPLEGSLIISGLFLFFSQIYRGSENFNS